LSAPLYHIFPHYLTEARLPVKEVVEHKMYFDNLHNSGKEENQLDANNNFLFIDKSNSARRVSGNNFAHLQELLTL